MKKEFYSNGKLLLTGEYAVLDGALALAVPTRYGQSLSVTEIAATQLRWKSLDKDGAVWFEMTKEMGTLFGTKRPWTREGQPKTIKPSDTQETTSNGSNSRYAKTVETLIRILREAQRLNPNFLDSKKGYQVETRLDFHRDWGLGSSSTLLNNIAQWAGVDAYQLLWNSFSGSGYDIACAQHDTPILYRLIKSDRPVPPSEKRRNERMAGGTTKFSGEAAQWQIPATYSKAPEVEPIDFDPPFTSNIFFVYLNKKQNSREGIATYRKADFDKKILIQQISKITEQLITCQELARFESLIDRHEMLISEALDLPTVKESLFPDFEGSIKSLGAWGGDFVMVTGHKEVTSYFKDKGYTTLIPYQRMVLG